MHQSPIHHLASFIPSLILFCPFDRHSFSIQMDLTYPFVPPQDCEELIQGDAVQDSFRLVFFLFSLSAIRLYMLDINDWRDIRSCIYSVVCSSNHLVNQTFKLSRIHSFIRHLVFRWLESLPNSPGVSSFIRDQNDLTRDFLSKSEIRDRYRNRLESLWNVPKYGCPQRFGERIFFAYNEGMSEHATIFFNDLTVSLREEEEEEEEEVETRNDKTQSIKDSTFTNRFKLDDCSDKQKYNGYENNNDINKNKGDDIFHSAYPLLQTFLPEGASLRQVSVSCDGRFVAFSFNAGDGSDWVSVKFVHYPSKSEGDYEPTLLPDTILNIKHSSLSWYKNVGIFYNRYHDSFSSSNKPPLLGLNQRQKLCFHRLSDWNGAHSVNENDCKVAQEINVNGTEQPAEKHLEDQKEEARSESNAGDLDIVHFSNNPEWHVLGIVTECQSYLVCHVRDRCRLENLVWIARMDEILGERCTPSSSSFSSSSFSSSYSPSAKYSFESIDRSACFRFRFDDWLASFHFVTNLGNVFYFRTNYNSEFYSIVSFVIEEGERGRHSSECKNSGNHRFTNSMMPTTVVPEVSGVLLESAVPFDGDKLILVYLENVVNRLDIFSLKSSGRENEELQRISTIQLPHGSIQSIFGRLASPTAYFLFASFLRASTVYEIRVKNVDRNREHEEEEDGTSSRINIAMGEKLTAFEAKLPDIRLLIELRRLHQVPVIGFDADLFETTQVNSIIFIFSFPTAHISPLSFYFEGVIMTLALVSREGPDVTRPSFAYCRILVKRC